MHLCGSWIHGTASDAAKTAEFRAILRMRRHLGDHVGDAEFKNFTRLLLKVDSMAFKSEIIVPVI